MKKYVDPKKPKSRSAVDVLLESRITPEELFALFDAKFPGVIKFSGRTEMTQCQTKDGSAANGETVSMDEPDPKEVCIDDRLDMESLGTGDMDELIKIVLERIKSDGWTKLTKAMGYSNLSKGIRRIANFLSGEDLRPDLMIKLAEAFGLDKTEIIAKGKREKARLEKVKQDKLEASVRKNFKPHLRVLYGNARPTQLWMCGLVDGNRLLYIGVAPDQADRESLGKIIRQHFAENDGQLQFWGQIIGYRFQHTFDEAWQFNTDGQFLGVIANQADLTDYLHYLPT
ncbi:MAG: hypothetical protein HQM09_17480 [Candidatus Riflebacteria bacterium]|nr:hypothetical protein [Candidatus Riflebacteria bacterium]